MFFKFENINKLNVDLFKHKIIKRARARIALYPMRHNELILDDYLVKNTKLTLKQVCLVLMSETRLLKNSDSELIIKFKTDEFDKLASIITYGTGKIQGSNILRFAFKDIK